MKKITFEKFVEYGRNYSDANIVNGMPWSFKYEGFPVSHENDNLYLITRPDGVTVRFNRNTVLFTEGTHAYAK